MDQEVTKIIVVDFFEYELIRSARKSLSLQVKSDARLLVRAPRFLSKRRIDAFILSKTKWIQKIQTQQREKSALAESLKARLPKTKEEYRKEAKIKLQERVDFFAQRESLAYKQVRIGDAKTRWGSCGPTGNLNFSWRLILAPPSVLDYVVVHELAHLKHRNHSAAFWAEVERMLPDWKKERTWLRKHGFKLLA